MEELFKSIKLAKGNKEFGFGNPLFTQRFGADPFAMEVNGRVYVYTTHDVPDYDSDGKLKTNTYGKINTLNVISSDDLVNWTDHGVIQVGGPGGVAKWANNSWAPAAAHKTINGKETFFLYFANSANSIGVLTSDSPVGPWSDPLGKPLITRDVKNVADVKWLFDPAVLIDDDGKAYLYFGGGVPQGKEEYPDTARVVELGDDMVSLAGDPVAIHAPYFFEDSGINKIGDTYYYSYCSNWSSRDNAEGPNTPEKAEIIYMTSKSPLGPWEYQGSILKNPGVFFGAYGNNHHSLVTFNGKWYMFYHSEVLGKDMQLSAGGYRSPHVDEAMVAEDGTIQPITGTLAGAKQVKNLDPFADNEAETMAWMGGIETASSKVPSQTFGETNMAVNIQKTGSWTGLAKVDFGSPGATTFTAKVASESDGNAIEIRLDSIDGEAVGYLAVPNTGSADKFAEMTTGIKKTEGVHNLFFVFAGRGFRFDSWKFGNE